MAKPTKTNKQTPNKKTPVETPSDAALVADLDSTEGVSLGAPDELDEPYVHGTLLFIPDEARELYASQGYDLQWVRIYLDSSGTLDLNNIQKKERERCEFVKRDEVPGLTAAMTSFFKDKIEDNTFGLYIIGQLALAKVPFTYLKARRKALDEMTQARSKAIIDDLRKNSLLPDSGRGEKLEIVRQQPKSRNVDFGKQ